MNIESTVRTGVVLESMSASQELASSRNKGTLAGRWVGRWVAYGYNLLG